MIKSIICLASILVAYSARADVDQKASTFVLCKNQEKSVRSIRVTPASDGSYTTTYSKGGTEEVVGENRSLENSQSILASIESKLKKSSWNCREVSSAVVTTSSEVMKQ